MSDYVLIDGDTVNFDPAFGAAIVTVQPGTLVASGPGTLDGKPLCVLGDEGSVAVRGCQYMTPQYSIPGVGTLEIAALAADQQALRSSTGGVKLMLVGSKFTARFTVQTPAQQPPPGPGSPIPDATPQYVGTGSFSTHNTKLRGV